MIGGKGIDSDGKPYIPKTPFDGMNSAIDLSIPPYFNLEERNVCHSIAASSANLSTTVCEGTIQPTKK
jgi:hypothetical protein